MNSSARRNRILIFRWSLVLTVLIAIWDAIVYFWCNGNTSIIMASYYSGHATPISRWWDIATAPIWAVILVTIYTLSKKISDDDISIPAYYKVGSLLISFVSFTIGIFEGLVVFLLGFLILELAYSAIIGFVALAIWGIPRLVNSQFWQKIGLWLTAKDLGLNNNHT